MASGTPRATVDSDIQEVLELFAQVILDWKSKFQGCAMARITNQALAPYLASLACMCRIAHHCRDIPDSMQSQNPAFHMRMMQLVQYCSHVPWPLGQQTDERAPGQHMCMHMSNENNTPLQPPRTHHTPDPPEGQCYNICPDNL